MKIVKLTAENVKRIRAIEITPDGNTIVIAGRNGQGKTSVLDSIWFALGGGPAAKGTSKPIRDGEEQALVTLDLGQIVVTRIWKGDKTTLKVENADGAVYKSPQALLDSLVGRLSFDPLAFAQQDERKQLVSLLELVDLPFDVDELAARRAGLYEKRTDVGRRGKQLEGQLAGIPKPPDDTPSNEVVVADLLEEHRGALRSARAVEITLEECDGAQAEVERLTAVVEQAREALARAQDYWTQKKAELEGMDAEPDIKEIEARLASAESVNANVRARKQRAEVAAQVRDARDHYEQLTGEIETLDEQKSKAIAAAKMPIDGLAFDEDGVTYRGVPFKQCSAAEQLRVSLAMAMAMNPQIRVVRITDGSLLDSDNMRLIEEMAAAQDYQVWIERVDESGTVGVVIEDGQVAS